uniref:activator-dependent family glycosyltransferase n=1 Tax=Herbidospora sakaeratensis TaxID=564415 RepID=UPI0007857236|nr:activator-dependent family glycosyltransferase [Herbidospora sakaeratensis]
MRVLFVINPETTTLLPMVPMAWALRTAGHDVRVASQPGFAKEINQAGLTAVPVGRDMDMYRLVEVAMDVHEDIGHGLHRPFDVVDDPAKATWERMLPGYVEAVAEEHRRENFPIIADLVDFALHWEPDLVIWEPSTYAGGIAAKACGAASARQLISIDMFGVTRDHFLRLKAQRPPEDRADPLADWLGGYARKYGGEYTEDMASGHFTIDQLPPSLRREADLHNVPLRYVPYNGVAVVPDWLWQEPRRPRVALTLGWTAGERFATYTVDVQTALDALADLDVEVVATIAEAAQKELRVPDNARIVPFVPLHALAPTCSVVINHAGAGTLITTAGYGIPQLTLPWDIDEPELSRLHSAQGAGLTIRGDLASEEEIRTQVRRLLDEPSFAQRARDLRDEIHAMPTPNQLVPQLEELTAKYRSR